MEIPYYDFLEIQRFNDSACKSGYQAEISKKLSWVFMECVEPIVCNDYYDYRILKDV